MMNIKKCPQIFFFSLFLTPLFLTPLFLTQSAFAQIGLRSTGYLGGIFDVSQAYYRTPTTRIFGRPTLPSTVGKHNVDTGFSGGLEIGTEIDFFQHKVGLQMGLGLDIQIGQALSSSPGNFRFSDIFAFGRFKYHTRSFFEPFVSLRFGVARQGGDDLYSSHDYEAIQLNIGESFQKKIYLRDGIYAAAGGGFFIGKRTFIEGLYSFRTAERRTDDVLIELNYSAITVTLGYQFGDW